MKERPQPPVADYAAAKAAFTNLSKFLAEKYGPQGVRVNTVSPGSTRTPAWEQAGGFGEGLAEAMEGGELSEFLEEFLGQAGITLGRLTDLEGVARVGPFLVSGGTSAVIGSDYVIDGGSLKVA